MAFTPNRGGNNDRRPSRPSGGNFSKPAFRGNNDGDARPARREFSDRRSEPREPRGDRPAYGGNNRGGGFRKDFGGDRPQRDGERRPYNAGGAGRSFGDRPKPNYQDRGDRPAFKPRTERDGDSRPPRRFEDRPARPFQDRSAGSRFGGRDNERSGGDRPRRSFGSDDRPRNFDRPNGAPRFNNDGEQRPRRFEGGEGRPEGRSFGRPEGRPDSRGEGRPSFGDRNSRGSRPSFGGDRPARNFGDRPARPLGDRPARNFDDGDKPRFNKEGGNDRGPRQWQNRDDNRPRRSFGEGGNNGPRNFDRNDRGPREERPARFERGDRPRFDRNERSERPARFDRPDRGDRPARAPRNTDESRVRKRFTPESRDGQPETWSEREVKERVQQLRARKTTRDSFGTNVGTLREAPDYSAKLDEMERKLGKQQAAKGEPVKEVESVRLNKYIANAGICSRRDADQLIANGKILVNGQVVTEMGHKVGRDDVVTFGEKVLNPEKLVYILLNKPKDYLTTTEDPENRHTVMELVKAASTNRIFPVGRLDRNTTGLLVLTNDGDLAEKMTHPSFETRKIYQVDLDKPITDEHFAMVKAGVELEDGVAEVDEVEILSPDGDILGLAIHSGRNRIVRRIFESLGYEVVRLDRVMYAGLIKKDLPRGHWRYLTEQEVINLKYLMK